MAGSALDRLVRSDVR